MILFSLFSSYSYLSIRSKPEQYKDNCYCVADEEVEEAVDPHPPAYCLQFFHRLYLPSYSTIHNLLISPIIHRHIKRNRHSCRISLSGVGLPLPRCVGLRLSLNRSIYYLGTSSFTESFATGSSSRFNSNCSSRDSAHT